MTIDLKIGTEVFELAGWAYPVKRPSGCSLFPADYWPKSDQETYSWLGRVNGVKPCSMGTMVDEIGVRQPCPVECEHKDV